MSDKWDAYVKDPRKICKYGAKCYQKNPDHHKTYKHPPKNLKRNLWNKKPDSKRFKPSPRANSADREKDPLTEETKSDTKTNATEATSTGDPDESTAQERDIIKLPENLSYYDKDSDPETFKQLFLVEMPPDFFEFYKCLSHENGDFDKILTSVGLESMGPYDLLLGKLPILDDKELYLIHGRFFFDPPEFQTVLKKKGKTEFHMGYYRDSPTEAPVFVATTDSAKDCHITPASDNLFGAVYLYLQEQKKTSPFTSIVCQKLAEKIKEWAEKAGFSIAAYDMKKRQSQIVTKTFHGAGIVVPYNKKTQLGYRPLVETNANLKKMFTSLSEAKTQAKKDEILSELQPMITYANVAVDECDFGTGLEAGIALFSTGLRELEPNAVNTLTAVYNLLNRHAFSKIIQAHVKYRRKGPDMSILSS